jgi:hypothetical protein
VTRSESVPVAFIFSRRETAVDRRLVMAGCDVSGVALKPARSLAFASSLRLMLFVVLSSWMSPVTGSTATRPTATARKLLANSLNDITGVSHRVGYDCPSWFRQEDRRQFGPPPGLGAARLRAAVPVAAVRGASAKRIVQQPETIILSRRSRRWCAGGSGTCSESSSGSRPGADRHDFRSNDI